jgi:hypothetical protein
MTTFLNWLIPTAVTVPFPLMAFAQMSGHP